MIYRIEWILNLENSTAVSMGFLRDENPLNRLKGLGEIRNPPRLLVTKVRPSLVKVEFSAV